MSTNKYDYVISIGDFCFWAFYIRDCKWREASFPFDWMFTNLSFIIDCIEENFEPIMEYIKNKSQHGQRTYIGQPFPQPSTAHHKMQTDEDYQHYYRTIERWKQIMESDKKILFLHISGDFKNYQTVLCETFIKKINEKYPNLKCGMLCLKYTKDLMQITPSTTIQTTDNIIYWADIKVNNPPELGSWIRGRHVQAINELFNNPNSPIQVEPSNFDFIFKDTSETVQTISETVQTVSETLIKVSVNS